jgi:malonyl CoA-acyl carrier protein transacylase
VNETLEECGESGGKRKHYCGYAKFNPKIRRMGDLFMTLFTTAQREIALYFSKLRLGIGEILFLYNDILVTLAGCLSLSALTALLVIHREVYHRYPVCRWPAVG